MTDLKKDVFEMEKSQQSCPISYFSPLLKMDHNTSHKIFTSFWKSKLSVH